jgi:hypothetical protein
MACPIDPRCPRRLGALALAVVAATSGCAARVVKTPVYDQSGVQVFLRQQTKGGKAVERGFSHPITIAPARLTNLLARIEVRDEETEDPKGGRQPAIPTGVLYGVGEGAAQALTKADPSQEVVVMAVERKRTHGIFTNDHLTSLILWVKDDKLYVHLGQMGEVMPRDPKEKGVEPSLERIESKKTVLGGEGLTKEGPRLVAAEWRSNVFRDMSAIRVRPGGDVVRRTILVESPPDEDAATAPGPAPPPEGLSPEALRALADLEEVRRRGELTEGDYQMRRREILSGKLPAPAPASGTGAP